MWALDNGKVMREMGEIGTYKLKSNMSWYISNIVW